MRASLAPVANHITMDSAVCALHPEDRAVAICDRCGGFACEDCQRETRRGRTLCALCYRRYLQIRKEHFADEERVRGLALNLYLLALAAWGFGSVASVVLADASVDSSRWKLALSAALWVTLGVAFLIAGRGMADLNRQRRLLTIGLSVLALPAFPVGTVLGGLVLFRLARPGTAFVFTPAYQEVLEAVPDGRPEGRARRVLFQLAVLSLVSHALWLVLR